VEFSTITSPNSMVQEYVIKREENYLDAGLTLLTIKQRSGGGFNVC
jgi:hypothetical protein